MLTKKMVRCLKIKKQYGEQAKRWLASNGWLSNEHMIGKTQRYLLFPLNKSASVDAILKEFSGSVEERNLQKVQKKEGSFKELLKDTIQKRETDRGTASYDVVGDIAVLDIPKGLERCEKSIAWTLRRTHPNIKVVAKRASITEGEYRIRKIKVISGESRTETIHRENGLKFRVDLNKDYFSPRLGTERLRIANLVKPNERVLVMFAGVGPYALAIAKQQPKVKEVVGVEINEHAVELFKDNIRINSKAVFGSLRGNPLAIAEKRIKPLCGDANELVPRLGRFDRIVMPLPKLAHEFLDVAIRAAKKGGTIHFYTFVKVGELAKAKQLCRAAAKKIKITRAVTCGAYAPYINRVCIDLQLC